MRLIPAILLIVVSGCDCGGGSNPANLSVESCCMTPAGSLAMGPLCDVCCKKTDHKQSLEWTAASPAPAICGGSTADVRTSSDNAADKLATARDSLNNAFLLAGDQGGNGIGGAATLAATSADAGKVDTTGSGISTNSNSTGGDSAASDALKNMGANALGAKGSGSGSGAGAAGGGGSGGKGLGSVVGTSAATDLTQKNGNTESTTDYGSAGQYAAGGAGGGASGGASGSGGSGLGLGSLSSLFGGSGANGGTGDGASAEEMRFGRSPAGSEIPPMVSMDPEDYFTRISAETNIFKIVERRYQQRSIIWSKDRSLSIQSK